jgi:hypothetical protein
MANKDLSDFMLAEYENIAKAFINAYDIGARWFKYYLIILAVPFSFIALFYHNNTDKLNLFNLPTSIAILIAGVGVANIFVSYIIIDIKLDSVLYARQVNGVRKYFVEMGIQNLQIESEKQVKSYLVLPIDTNKPHFMRLDSDLFIQAVFMSLMNAVYFSGGFIQIDIIRRLYIGNVSEVGVFACLCLLTVVAQLTLFRYESRKKESEYCQD